MIKIQLGPCPILCTFYICQPTTTSHISYVQSTLVIGAGATKQLVPHLGQKVVDTVLSKLVVNQTTKGDGVSEGLERSNGVAEDDHRGNDEEDILENSGQSKDESGGFANLSRISEQMLTNSFSARHTRKTTATLSPKATAALRNRVPMPSW